MKQITTSVGFQDAKGNLVANGLLMLQLSQNVEVTATGGQVTTEPLYFPLDANAKITPTNILFNDEATPSGTTYRAVLYAANQIRIIQDFGSWSIAGASADLSTMTPSSSGASFPSPAPSFVTVAFSATPTFTGPAGLAENVTFKITLTGNVTSSTLTGVSAGQMLTFIIIQDSSGGHTFAWPTNVKNPQSIDPTVGAINVQSFIFDGTNAYPIGPMTVN